MLPAACLSKYAILLDFFIEASKSTFEWLIITDIYLSHSHTTPLLKSSPTIIAFMETVCQGKLEEYPRVLEVIALQHVTDSSCKKDFIVLCYESFMLGWLVYFASKVVIFAAEFRREYRGVGRGSAYRRYHS
jgi:hypothetical protein